MAYPISAGIEISLNGTTWYKLTDHNRSSMQVTPSLIEKESRMANGSMRKYVVAKKDIISVSWDYVPAKADCIVDGNYGGAWLEAFYYANCFIPIYVRVRAAKDTVPSIGSAPNDSTFITSQNANGYKQYNAYMTDFSKTVVHRTTTTDYLNMNIEFTEI